MNSISINSGFFTGYMAWNNGQPVKLENETHPLAANLPKSIDPNIEYPYSMSITNGDIVNIYKQDPNSVLAYRKQGLGTIIYSAIYTTQPNVNGTSAQMLANGIKFGFNEKQNPTWLDYTPKANPNMSFPNGSETIYLNFNSGSLLGGTYKTNLVFNSNDPLKPEVIVPITMIVTGVAKIDIAPAKLDFGNIIIGNTKEFEFTVTNSGTDVLNISEIQNAFPEAFTFSTNAPLEVKPKKSKKIKVTFAPKSVLNYGGKFTFKNNVGDAIIDVTAAGVGAPETTIDPAKIDVTLLAGDEETFKITITNSGEGPLTWGLPGGSNKLNITVLSYGADTWYKTYYDANLKTALDAKLGAGNYNLTYYEKFVPGDLAKKLENTNLAVIYNQYDWNMDKSSFSDMSMALKDFTNKGGGILILGNTSSVCMTEYGLFPVSYTTYIYTAITPKIPDHPILEGVSASIVPPSNTYGWVLSNTTGIDILAEDPVTPGSMAYGVTTVGAGRVVYLAHDLYQTNPDVTALVGNSVAYASGGLPKWVIPSSTGGTVEMSKSFSFDLLINADNMLAGVYKYSMPFLTNEPDKPVIFLPITLTVEAFPQANFSANQVSCDGKVFFKDKSLNFPTSWEWDFGDGNTSSKQNPDHQYEKEGFYNVSLTATNDIGSDTKTVNNFIEVNYSYEYCDTVCMPTTGEVLMQACHGVLYDPGCKGTLPTVTESITTIAPPGAIEVVLTFTEFQAPSWGFTMSFWDGPNTNSPFIGQYDQTNPPAAIKATTGALTMKLTNSSGDGFSSGFVAHWDCILIAAPPVIDFKHEVTSECEGEVQFTDLSTNYPNEWSWNFGDGNTSTEQNPLHQYEQSGDYTVSLNAKNIKGATEGNKTMTLENVLYIQVDLPMFPEKGKPCQFVDKTVGAKDWFWDFGNGKVSIGKANPLTVYSDPGTYQVTLEVTDDKGCVRQKTFTIEAVTVGIDNPGANMLNIGVQPNPATDKVIIDANFIGQQNINLSVYDLLGREVYANSSVAANTYKHTLDVAHFAQGVYMVTITNGNVSRTQKLVVE